MNKRILTLVVVLLSAAMLLSACDAVDEYNRSRGLVPATGERGDNWNDNDNLLDNTNDNVIDNDNNNDARVVNDNLNDNGKGAKKDNASATGRANRNPNAETRGGNDNNDNWNDNEAIAVTGEDDDRYSLDDLIGADLETESGERMGRVNSVLIHPISGKIHYLVVEADRDLDLDDDYVLVPWNALHTRLDRDDDRPLAFGFGRDTMRRSPSFRAEDLDDRDGRFEDRTVDYWREHVDDVPRIDDEGRRRGYLRLTDGDYALYDRDGDRIGEITDFFIHRPSGQINHVRANAGNLLDRQRVIVPYNRLDWSAPNDGFILTLNQNQWERLPRD